MPNIFTSERFSSVLNMVVRVLCVLLACAIVVVAVIKIVNKVKDKKSQDKNTGK